MKKAPIAVALVAVVALAGPALAGGKGGGKGGGSTSSGTGSRIDVNQSAPRYGDSVTFTTSYPATNETVVVALKCSQDGVLKFQLVRGPDASFPLGGSEFPTDWTGGAAHCTADLLYYTYRGQILTGAVYLAHTEFDVAA